jgi:hypothetical protein
MKHRVTLPQVTKMRVGARGRLSYKQKGIEKRLTPKPSGVIV